MHFEMYQDHAAKREWRWRLQAANNRILAVSAEGFKTKVACQNSIRLIIEGVSAETPVQRP